MKNLIKEYEDENIKLEYKNDILFLYFKIEKINLKHAISIVEQINIFIGDHKVLLLSDGTKVRAIDKSARDYFGIDNGNSQLKAMAILTGSKLSIFLANFIIKVNLIKMKAPIKLFDNKKRAIEWLKKNY